MNKNKYLKSMTKIELIEYISDLRIKLDDYRKKEPPYNYIKKNAKLLKEIKVLRKRKKIIFNWKPRCIYCRKIFKPKRGNQVYCSDECRSKGKKIRTYIYNKFRREKKK